MKASEGLELTPRYNQVMNLYLDGLRHKDIAQQLGMTESMVSVVVNAPNFQHQLAIRQATRNETVDKQAVDHVMEARSILQRSACDAAKRLVEKLDADKEVTQLAAAESVLDRIGIPKVSKSDITQQSAVIMLDAKTAAALAEGLKDDD